MDDIVLVCLECGTAYCRIFCGMVIEEIPDGLYQIFYGKCLECKEKKWKEQKWSASV